LFLGKIDQIVILRKEEEHFFSLEQSLE
jgi:hypothetical protein